MKNNNKLDNTKTQQESNTSENELLAAIPDILNKLQIDDWDVLLIGDGSGAGWNLLSGCGWASVLIDKYSNNHKIFMGATTPGTITIGELSPYLFAMNWYMSSDGPGRSRVKDASFSGRPLRVHIISDSEIIVKSGNNTQSRKSNRALWAAMDFFATQGCSMQYHHINRNTILMNVLMDELARQSRIDPNEVWDETLKNLKKKEYLNIQEGATIYDFSKDRDT